MEDDPAADDRNLAGNPLASLVCGSGAPHLVELVHSPSTHLYQALQHRLQHAHVEFLVEFLHLGGLNALLKVRRLQMLSKNVDESKISCQLFIDRSCYTEYHSQTKL